MTENGLFTLFVFLVGIIHPRVIVVLLFVFQVCFMMAGHGDDIYNSIVNMLTPK